MPNAFRRGVSLVAKDQGVAVVCVAASDVRENDGVIAHLEDLANRTKDVRDSTGDHYMTASAYLMSHAGEAILRGAREAASKVGLAGG